MHCTITMDEVEGTGTGSSPRTSPRSRRAVGGRRDVRRGRGGSRRGLPVLGADPRERDRDLEATLEEGTDGRPHRARHLERLAHGGRRHDRRGRERRLRAARRHLGVARRGAGRPDEPRRSSSPRRTPRASRWRSRTASRRRGTPPERLDVDATVTFVPGTGITKIALAVSAVGARARRGRLPRSCRGRDGELPGLEGARRRARDHARRARSPSAPYPPAMAIDRLVDELDRSYAEAQERMSDPAVYNDHRQAAEAGAPEGARDAEEARRRVAQAREDLDAARDDPELAEMAPEFEDDLERLEEELSLALVERDPADEKDVIVEVRQGVGGDEAALWAGDVRRMLTRYAERLGSRPRPCRRARARAAASRRSCSRSRERARSRSSSSRAGRIASSASPRPSRRAGSTRRPRQSP